MKPQRSFLGWDAPALPRAAEELRDRFGDDFDGVLVALPGGRAARRLEDLLLARCAKSWTPPRIGTIGMVTDALVHFSRPRAGGMAREVAWIAALRGMPAAALAAVTNRRPDAEDLAGWAALATQLRALHQELAAERRCFADVAACDALPAPERARWRALVAIQQDYLARIAGAGLCDPHADRMRALAEERPLRAARALVLLGTASVNALQEECVRRAAAQGVEVLALVVAPESEAASFDAFGWLRAEAWKDRAVPLDDALWRVADRPADQAEEADAFLRAVCGGSPDARATVAVLHGEITPFLARRLAQDGPGLRPPVGRTLAETSPGRLLDAQCAWLGGRSPRAFATLVRHPDLAEALGGGDYGAACDEYSAAVLPARLDGTWPTHEKEETPWYVARLSGAYWKLEHLAGGLAGRDARTLAAWSREAAGFLSRVFAGADARATAGARETREALDRLAAALDEVAALPLELGGAQVSAAEFLRLLLHACGRETLAPDPAREGLEQLGWLELPLDEAPALCVLGFQLGAVPEAVHGHAFLPETLRVALGLPSNEDRRARDVLALHVLAHARERLLFVSGQRGTAGDPWLPSPLVFQGADAPARVRAFFRAPDPRPAATGGATSAWTPPLPPEPQPVVVESFSASALNLYLKSPRLYWLQHVLGLETVEAEPHELDALKFGSFVHAVLQRFHTEDRSARLREPEALYGAVRKALRGEAARTFGERPLAAVRLQVAQLEGRLRGWADHEARSRAEGWETITVEHAVEREDPVRVTLDGEQFGLHGRLDRVDRRTTGDGFEIRVLDYKSGDKPKSAGDAFKKNKGRWDDLQLPVYLRIARAAFPGARNYVAGWFNLPRGVETTGIVTPPWDAGVWALADGAVVTAVRGIRAGRFAELGDPDRRNLSSSLLALLGEVPALDAGEEDAGEEEAES